MSKLTSHCGTQPTNLSQLLSEPAQAGHPLPGIFGLDIGLRPTLADLSPSTTFIFRTQINGPDTGAMYQGDPIAAGRAWVDLNYPIWKQNEADYFAIINEPGRNDLAGLTWLCSFYLGAMQRADDLGIKLCIGEWSTGMPPISAAESAEIVKWIDSELTTPWTEAELSGMSSQAGRYKIVNQLLDLKYAHESVIEEAGYINRLYAGFFGAPTSVYIDAYTPMLRYAMAHGHILGLHEYSLSGPMIGNPLCLRYRQLYNALPADARPPIAITEAGPGAGYGTGYTMAAYVNVVAAYDAEIMQDRYLICACLFHHGKGESNLSEAVPLLTDYIVKHPTPVPPPDPGGNMPIIFGPHSTATPGPVLSGDLTGVTAAQRFNGYKYQTGDPPSHYTQIGSLGIPQANCLTRLYIDLRGEPVKPTPADFCQRMNLAINEAMSAGVLYFEIHNEPNLGKAFGDRAEWPYSDDPHDFIDWLLGVSGQPGVIQLLRAQHPGIRLVSPGLSPQANTPSWWIELGAHGVFDACDAIGAHCYWPDRQTMLTQQQGLNFIPLEPMASATKPIFLTEVSNNQTASTDMDKGAQYCDYVSYLMAHHPKVKRVYVYIISSDTPEDSTSRQTIVRNGVVSEIATGIRLTPIVEPSAALNQFEHSHLDGGAADTSNPRSITMDANHALLADFVPIPVPVKRFFLTVTVSPPGSGSVTLTPPQPVDGYVEGQVVSAAFTPL